MAKRALAASVLYIYNSGTASPPNSVGKRPTLEAKRHSGYN